MNEKNEWDLSPLLKDDNDPKIDDKRKLIREKHKEFSDKWRNNKDYLSDVNKLKEVLDEFEELNKLYVMGGEELYYFIIRSYQDQSNEQIKSKVTKAEDFSHETKDEIRFFELSLAKITREKQEEFLENNLLQNYKHYLENIFKKAKHLLTENEEKIMSLKRKVAYDNWENLTQEFLSKSEEEVVDEKGNKKKMGFHEIYGNLAVQDKEFRARISNVFEKIIEKYHEMAVIELNSLLENKKIDDNLRKFERPDSSRHLEDDIDEEVVDILLKTVSSKFSFIINFRIIIIFQKRR